MSYSSTNANGGPRQRQGIRQRFTGKPPTTAASSSSSSIATASAMVVAAADLVAAAAASSAPKDTKSQSATEMGSQSSPHATSSAAPPSPVQQTTTTTTTTHISISHTSTAAACATATATRSTIRADKCEKAQEPVAAETPKVDTALPRGWHRDLIYSRFLEILSTSKIKSDRVLWRMHLMNLYTSRTGHTDLPHVDFARKNLHRMIDHAHVVMRSGSLYDAYIEQKTRCEQAGAEMKSTAKDLKKFQAALLGEITNPTGGHLESNLRDTVTTLTAKLKEMKAAVKGTGENAKLKESKELFEAVQDIHVHPNQFSIESLRYCIRCGFMDTVAFPGKDIGACVAADPNLTGSRRGDYILRLLQNFEDRYSGSSPLSWAAEAKKTLQAHFVRAQQHLKIGGYEPQISHDMLISMDQKSLNFHAAELLRFRLKMLKPLLKQPIAAANRHDSGDEAKETDEDEDEEDDDEKPAESEDQPGSKSERKGESQDIDRTFDDNIAAIPENETETDSDTDTSVPSASANAVPSATLPTGDEWDGKVAISTRDALDGVMAGLLYAEAAANLAIEVGDHITAHPEFASNEHVKPLLQTIFADYATDLDTFADEVVDLDFMANAKLCLFLEKEISRRRKLLCAFHSVVFELLLARDRLLGASISFGDIKSPANGPTAIPGIMDVMPELGLILMLTSSIEVFDTPYEEFDEKSAAESKVPICTESDVNRHMEAYARAVDARTEAANGNESDDEAQEADADEEPDGYIRDEDDKDDPDEYTAEVSSTAALAVFAGAPLDSDIEDEDETDQKSSAPLPAPPPPSQSNPAPSSAAAATATARSSSPTDEGEGESESDAHSDDENSEPEDDDEENSASEDDSNDEDESDSGRDSDGPPAKRRKLA